MGSTGILPVGRTTKMVVTQSGKINLAEHESTGRSRETQKESPRRPDLSGALDFQMILRSGSPSRVS